MYWKASTSLPLNSDMAVISVRVKILLCIVGLKTRPNPIQEYPLVLEWGIYQSIGKSERHQVHFYSWGRWFIRHTFLNMLKISQRTTLISLNVFIANTKQGVGPQVFPSLVTALPLQYEYKALHRQWRTNLSRDMRIQTMRYMRPAKARTSLRIRAV